MNEVAKIKTGKTFSLVPENLEQAMKLAEIMANSDMVPKDFHGKPGNVLVAVQMGGELGLPPTQALQNIAVINGRPSLWGDAALAVVQGHPKFVSIKEWHDTDADAAVCVIVRKGEEPHTVTFSRLDAQDAGLLTKSGPWKQYPKRMMQMRARSFALRDKFADALKGISIAEEARDIQPIDMGDANVVNREPAERVVESLPEYPAEKFAENVDLWEKLIHSGNKTADQIISMISTKFTLSDEQKATISAIKVGQEDVE